MEYSINVDWILLVDGDVEFYILADFQAIVLSVTEGKLLKSPTVIVTLSISPFSSSVFPSHILELCCLMHIDLGLLCLHSGLTLLSLNNVPLSLVISFILKSTLSDVIATSAFLSLVFTWYILFHSCTFNLPASYWN